MGTKNISVDARVYERLVRVKREGESFSRAIERLLDEIRDSHSGSKIVHNLESISSLSEEDSHVFHDVVAEDRADND